MRFAFQGGALFLTMCFATKSKATLISAASREHVTVAPTSDIAKSPAIVNVTALSPENIPPFTYPIPDSRGLIIKGEPEGLQAKTMQVKSFESLIDRGMTAARGFIARGQYSIPDSGFLQWGHELKMEVDRADGVDFTFSELLVVLPAIKEKLHLIEYEECTIIVSRKGRIREREFEAELGYVNIQYRRSAGTGVSGTLGNAETQ